MNLSLSRIIGPNGIQILSNEIDLKVVQLRKKRIFIYDKEKVSQFYPDCLLRDDRTTVPPRGCQGGYGGGKCVTSVPVHESRQFWLTVHVLEKYPSGIYRGSIQMEVKRATETKKFNLPVEIEILPIDLHPVEGNFGIFYPVQPREVKRKDHVHPDRYLAELKDQVRHGLNATVIYDNSLDTLKYASQAGMKGSPCMGYTPKDANPRLVEDAKAMGFNDLYFYGCEEPHPNKKGSIEKCKELAEYCKKQNEEKEWLHMMASYNNIYAEGILENYVDRPIFSINVFDCSKCYSDPEDPKVKYNPAVMRVLQKDFEPVSTWMTEVSYPCWYRTLAGIYNTRCGYVGTFSFAYQHAVDESGQWIPNYRLYSADERILAVSYPDNCGNPISTLRWEAFREGIDDVRYLQALDRAIADAKKLEPFLSTESRNALENAIKVRRKWFEKNENLTSSYWKYQMSLEPHTLDTMRREMASAIVDINSHLRK